MHDIIWLMFQFIVNNNYVKVVVLKLMIHPLVARLKDAAKWLLQQIITAQALTMRGPFQNSWDSMGFILVIILCLHLHFSRVRTN